MKFGAISSAEIQAKYQARKELERFREMLKRQQRLKIEPAKRPARALPIARSDFIKPLTRAQLMAGK